MSPQILHSYASELAGGEVGKNWVSRFQNRHKDIKVRWTTSLEACRAQALNPTLVREFFELLRDIILQYGIPPENIYNMDEKGILLGVLGRMKAIFDRDQKTLQQIAQGTRDLLTIIECLCADGTCLPPSVIFEGKRRNLAWGEKNPCNAR